MRYDIRSFAVAFVLMMGCARAGQDAGENDGPVDRFTSAGVETFPEGSESAKALMSTDDGDAEECDIGEQSQGLRNTAAAKVSCSSRDGSMDCYCTNGCCRTEHTCTCCGSSLTWGGVPLEAASSVGGLTF